MPQTADRTSAALWPASRIRARPWVRSVTLTASPETRLATSPSRASTSAACPGGAITSHSPGPEPTIRSSASLLRPRPNGTASSAAAWPPAGARSRTLASGVQSVKVSSPAARRPLTSQPARTISGSGGRIGLRASGSDTHPPSVRVDVGKVRHDPRLDQAAGRQPHAYLGARRREPRLDLGEADRPPEGGRHPARGDPAGDVVAFHDQAGLIRHDRTVRRLQRDQSWPRFLRMLPGEFWLADEVFLVQLDGPIQLSAKGLGQPIGVLADDEMALFQPQDALGLDAEGRNA